VGCGQLVRLYDHTSKLDMNSTSMHVTPDARMQWVPSWLVSHYAALTTVRMPAASIEPISIKASRHGTSTADMEYELCCHQMDILSRTWQTPVVRSCYNRESGTC
jgi:hypothetical protein